MVRISLFLSRDVLSCPFFLITAHLLLTVFPLILSLYYLAQGLNSQLICHLIHKATTKINLEYGSLNLMFVLLACLLLPLLQLLLCLAVFSFLLLLLKTCCEVWLTLRLFSFFINSRMVFISILDLLKRL